jgi:hypothetical protein
MKALEFITAFHHEVLEMVLPNCKTILESAAVGFLLEGLSYQLGKKVNDGTAQGLGYVNEDGDVDLDAVENSLVNGIKWPLKIKPFTFTVDDAKAIMSKLRGA